MCSDLDNRSGLSVIVPVYNEGQEPIHCLQRLAFCEDIREVIMVDTSDDPESLEVLAKLELAKSVRLVKASDRGRARQMNLGAELAEGHTLLFLHCDTELPSDAAISIRECLQRYDWGRFDITLNASGWRFRLIETMMKLRSRFTNIATGDQAMFMKRDWFRTQGMFADIPLMEDIEFSKRVSRESKPGIAPGRVITSARRWQKYGVWKTVLLMWKLRWLYRMGTNPEKLAAMYLHAR
ncbi:MAG: TIGR04283 family arsenosugar biosynthesis glycosyltransferase [Acidiferrobacterales bacterium]|nr:TIGR04283 family arsenosugar biosynthesis glycosyltransferase [Acidiferrobacterales bacterium]